MAISRKVIVFDFHLLEPAYVSSSAFVVLALGLTYWLLDKNINNKCKEYENH
ncbi:MAG: phosphate-starvation-inducible PsiE family protein [Methylococcales bacterium]|nr:phosphate-starvation-inducible PsiE family protein [Methylococcales bacterium]